MNEMYYGAIVLYGTRLQNKCFYNNHIRQIAIARCEGKRSEFSFYLLRTWGDCHTDLSVRLSKLPELQEVDEEYSRGYDSII